MWAKSARKSLVSRIALPPVVVGQELQRVLVVDAGGLSDRGELVEPLVRPEAGVVEPPGACSPEACSV